MLLAFTLLGNSVKIRGELYYRFAIYPIILISFFVNFGIHPENIFSA